ncbi:MAG: flagellar basal body rod protein FlgB [Burkholderiales bacterium]
MSAIHGILAGATSDLVLRALDAAVVRHAVHAANIANASVEGYQPLRVEFEDQLAAARSALVGRDDAAAQRAAASLEPQVVPEAEAQPVQLDREVALMMENSVRYQALLSALGKNAAMLRLAIREGRS